MASIIAYIFGIGLCYGLVAISNGDSSVTAKCIIEPNSGVAAVKGTIRLSQPAGGGNITIDVQLSGFNGSGSHGFHVHQFGDLGNKCNNCAAHYNPFNKNHGAPNDTDRHVGDLGNVVADSNGVVRTVITDNIVSLIGDQTVVNRSIVVHELQDDLGRGGYNDSKTTGHAGKRYGCCIIQLDSTSRATATAESAFCLLISFIIALTL